MGNFRQQIDFQKLNGVFRNEQGAIDLASIMVGVIVIGLIGGVVASTVFAVIPWTQDKAAKQQLDSIVAAQSSYRGLSSGVPPATPSGHPVNSYADSKQLASAGLLSEGERYCTTGTQVGKGFIAVVRSDSGKYWAASGDRTQPSEISPMDVPENCGFPYIDKTPTLTNLTYECPTTQEVAVPIRDGKGVVTWSDGVSSTHTINSESNLITRTLHAGVEYKFSFDGKYSGFGSTDQYRVDKGSECLRSLDHWGSETGVKVASYAFMGAINLTDVPAKLPESIEQARGMFKWASTFNDADVSAWDISNLTSTAGMFFGASAFNQPLNDWDVSNVTNMGNMFESAHAFDQPLDKWDVSNLKEAGWMFAASGFNQPLNSWDVSNVENMSGMLHWMNYNHPLDEWDVSNVKDMSRMFEQNKVFNHPLDMWDVSSVENMNQMFIESGFLGDLSGWKTTSLKHGEDFTNMANFQSSKMPPGTSKTQG